jgi:hypothetical protein
VACSSSLARRASARVFGTRMGSDTVMICQQCHEREATVHITEQTDQFDRTMDLCEACCRKLRPEVVLEPMQQEGYSCTIIESRGSQGSETK